MSNVKNKIYRVRWEILEKNGGYSDNEPAWVRKEALFSEKTKAEQFIRDLESAYSLLKFKTKLFPGIEEMELI